MENLYLLLPVLLPAVTGLVLLLARPRKSDTPAFLAAVLTAVLAAFGGNRILKLPFTEGVSCLLAPDGLSLFFLLLIACAFACALLYAREYLAGDERRPLFYGFALLTLGSMMGLSMAGNMVTFYMFYEMMSLFSFPLVLYNGGEKPRRAALFYLGFSVFGACLALMGLLLGGETTLKAFSEPVAAQPLTPMLVTAFFLMALGFSCKAGMMPLANWLPIAHPEAPAPASALLSGIITKAGILGMIRTAFCLFGSANLAGTWAQKVLLILSVVTIFTGSMLAYKEKLLKKRLAYSSVSQLSYVIFGLMLMSRAGLEGALLQVLFHACAKVGLFLCAGAFIHHAGAHYVQQLRGMGRKMPVVMACFTCFSLSLVGIPPFGGFISKWQLASAALAQGSVTAQVGVVILMVSALLTAGYLLDIVSAAYFPGEDFGPVKKKDAGFAMVLPLCLLAAAAALLGLVPESVLSFFHSAAAGFF